MQNKLGKIGIIGGTGWLGSAIIKQMLLHDYIQPAEVWVSNRSGKRIHFENYPAIHVTNDNQELINHCDTLILSVRPQDFLSLNIKVRDHLIISVMAGVTTQHIADTLAAERVVRAMPNAAVEIGLSYTPWFATASVDQSALMSVQILFSTFGETDQVFHEDQIDFFTALTGSGQGWVAFFESCLIQCAIKHGLKPDMAERSIRQLFRGMGNLLFQSPDSMEAVVKLLVDYAGTTAAGLIQMQNTRIVKDVESGITAAYQKAKSDMTASDE